MRAEPHTFVRALPDFKTVEAVRTFALRVARLMIIRQHCQGDHPILSIEEDLVQMARSRLQEYILVSIPRDAETRLAVSQAVLEVVSRRIQMDEEDPVRLSRIFEDLQSFPLDDIFPRVH